MSPRLRLTTFLTIVFFLCAISAEAQTRRRTVTPSPTPLNEQHSEGGYASATSVPQGGAIRFHIATTSSPFTLHISNLADQRISAQIPMLESRIQSCSGGFTTGCRWDATTTFDVPASWPSGYYQASFPTSFGTRRIIFVVRPAQPGLTSKILVVSPTNTYQAFNAFGGASLNAPTSRDRAARLTFDRPYEQAGGLGRFDSWERTFVNWMRDTGRQFEVVTDHDLHDPTLLSNYNVVVLVGHSAYWTETARERLETYSENGGHIAILGGNTMWFRVELGDDGRTLVGDPSGQTEIGSEPTGIITSNWYRHPVNQPENRIVATSFRHGGQVNRAPIPDRYEMVPIEQRTPWTVTDAAHWVFAGTGLAPGSTFGRETTGLEVDGVVFNCDSAGRVADADGSDEAPRNYHVLAVVPSSLGWGTMGYYVNPAGGAVFNAASQGWVWGLESNEIVQRITANVLDHFATGAPLVYDPPPTALFAEDLFNCPPTGLAQPGWRTNAARGAVTAACAFEGPGGLELSGPTQIGLARSIAPAGAWREHVELRFYVKADEFVQRTEFPRPIVTLQDRTGDTVRQVAHVEIDVTGGTRRVRLARRDAAGNFAATTDWVPLANGWHLIEATWRSPGTMALQVDGGTVLTLENPVGGQSATEMVIEFPPAQITEGGRLCIDAIAAGSEKPGRVAQLR